MYKLNQYQKLIIIFFVLVANNSLFSQQSIYKKNWIDFNKNGKKDIYEDATKPIDQRVEDLLSQMTMEEKTCQLATLYGYGAVLKDRLPQASWKDSVWKDGIANIDEQLTGLRKDTMYAFPYSLHAEAINTIQKWFVEETRLGIPVDFTAEGIRGLNHHKATYFPSQLAQASSFNRDLVYKIGDVTGREAKALGYTNVYSPILDVASDPRWGRVEETYGSDPYLVSQLGLQNIRAIQKHNIVSTSKHFAVYSIPAGGRDGDARVDPHISPRKVWDTYLEPFRVAFQEGKGKGVMASYNDYDGVPIIGSRYFLTDILRNKFGFDGYVVSDSHAFEDLFDKHKVVKDTAEAAVLALTAGMNVRTAFQNPRFYINGVRRAIKEGMLSMDVVDQRVREVLQVKFWLGLFDSPYVEDVKQADEIVHNKEARELAMEAAIQGGVLLKNANELLPLNLNNLNTVAVIGPNAMEKKSLLSRYGPNNIEVSSVYEGLKNYLPERINLMYAKGCAHKDSHFPESDVEDFDLTEDETTLLNEAGEIASKADIVFLVVGDNEYTVGEFYSRLNLKLPGRQDEFVKRIVAAGKPVVLIHVGGRPTTLNFADKHVGAIIESWYLGECQAEALAKIIFGEVNPSGKLCMPFPKHVGQLPLSFPIMPASDGKGKGNVSGWLYPFGYGLSYTTFAYGDLDVDTSGYANNETITVSFTVTNTGKREGTEIAQLYIRDLISSVVTYEKKLRGFERVSLKPGETKRVTVQLRKDDFSLYNQDMESVVEPGEFRIMVGASSEDIRLEKNIML